MDACGVEVYPVHPQISSLADCATECPAARAINQGPGCVAEIEAVQACTAALSCADWAAFVTSIPTPAQCVTEWEAHQVCWNAR